MNNYISIKTKTSNTENGKLTIFIVPAMALSGSTKIPHPLGDDILEFKTLDEATRAISLAGFPYILPNGTKSCEKQKPQGFDPDSYGEIIYNALLELTKENNSNVVATSIGAIGEIKYKNSVNLFIDKMGEDNEAIRNNAINALANIDNDITNNIISALKDENWVRRNSALSCIKKICKKEGVDVTKFIDPVLERLKDVNPLVKCSAISTIADVYKKYRQQFEI